MGTKVCEKALGGDESACLWALASKGNGNEVPDKKRQTVTCDSVLLRVRAQVLCTPQVVKAVFDFDK